MKLAVADDDDLALPRPVLLHHLGLDDEVVAAVDWWDLDRTVEPDHLTSLYVPGPVPVDRSAGGEVAQLVALMDTLRERCPWDRAQTHGSLMPHLVEETYEVLDALADAATADGGPTAGRRTRHLARGAGRPALPDRLPRPAGRRGGRFDLADVARGVHDKLVHRHPHVFGDVGRRQRGPGRRQLGGDQEEREGPQQRHRGHPRRAARPDARDQAGAQGARRSAWSPTTRRRARSATALAALSRRGRGHRSRSPTTRCRPTPAISTARWASSSSPWRTWPSASASTPNRRCATARCALRADILAAEGVPEPAGGQPLALCPGVPPGATPKERCREHH